MTDEEHAGAGFTHDQARAMKAELERELGDRRRFYPGMIDKGLLDPRDADRRIALFADMLEDHGRAFHPDFQQRRELPLSNRRFTWREKIAELRRELALRERFYPDRITKGRLTEDESRRRIAALQLVHDLYWKRCHCWEPDGELAREAHAERIRQCESGEMAKAAQAAREHYQRHKSFPPSPPPPPGDLAMREEMQAHLRDLVDEGRQEQQELGV